MPNRSFCTTCGWGSCSPKDRLIFTNLPGVATPLQKKKMRALIHEEVHLWCYYETIVWSTSFWDNLFHLFITLSEKKHFLVLSLLLFFVIFHEWPLVLLSTLRSRNVWKVTLDNPPFNFNSSNTACYVVPEVTITQAFSVGLDNTVWSRVLQKNCWLYWRPLTTQLLYSA